MRTALQSLGASLCVASQAPHVLDTGTGAVTRGTGLIAETAVNGCERARRGHSVPPRNNDRDEPAQQRPGTKKKPPEPSLWPGQQISPGKRAWTLGRWRHYQYQTTKIWNATSAISRTAAGT